MFWISYPARRYIAAVNIKVNYRNPSISYIKPNWISSGLTSEDIEKALVTAYRKFYFRPSKILNMIKDTKFCQYKHIFHRLVNIGFFKKI